MIQRKYFWLFDLLRYGMGGNLRSSCIIASNERLFLISFFSSLVDHRHNFHDNNVLHTNQCFSRTI